MIGRSVAAALGLSVVAGMGFSKGLNTSGASQEFFNSISGNPNLDQDVLGTRLTAEDLIMPAPIPFVPSRLQMAMHGAPGMKSGLPRLLGTLGTGFVNSKSISAGITRANNPFYTGNYSPSNKLPEVDGSLIFGMYNARYGG